MQNFFSYHKPLMRLQTDGSQNLKFFEEAIQCFQQKNYKESLDNVLKYYDPKSDILKNNSLEFSHGSVKVYLTIKDDKLFIQAPFVKISETPSVALLRTVSNFNFERLFLSQIRLNDESLSFEYQEHLSLCHPQKITAVLREICFTADHHDDILVEKFGAELFHEPTETPIDDKQMTLIHKQINEIINEAEQNMDYFKSRRLEPFAVDVGLIASYMIVTRFEPQGYMSSLLSETIRNLNTSPEMPKKIHSFTKLFTKIKEWDAQKMKDYFYTPNYFIHPKQYVSLEEFSNFFERYLAQAKQEVLHKDYMGASLSLSVGLYGALYSFELPEHLRKTIESQFQSVSGKPLPMAAKTLYKTFSGAFNSWGANKPASKSNSYLSFFKGVFNG